MTLSTTDETGVARSRPRAIGKTLAARWLSLPASELPPAIVNEAQLRGGSAAALYVVDLEGVTLRLVSGSPWWPHDLRVRGGVGPDMPRHALDHVEASLRTFAPDSIVLPLAHAERAVGCLAWEGTPTGDVEEVVDAAAIALEAADRRTDVIARARRARPTTPVAEIQENLLPPRLAQLAGGGEIAAAIIPAYDFGGDWFDYAENPEGVWLAVADAAGAGVPAAAPSFLALGALRAARRTGASVEQAARAMDETIKELADPGAFVTAILAQWVPFTGELRWLRFGHPLPIRVAVDGSVQVFGDDSGYVPLGLLDAESHLTVESASLAPGERLLLTSDGVWERQAEWGRRLEVAGIRAALATACDRSAAGTVSAVTSFVRRASRAPLDDDATVLCLGVGAS